jgi:60 kDa SS-A/Ro ribonucleoprotein
VDARFVAKTAVHAREEGYMKDTPAVLLAALSARAPELFQRVFFRVVDNGRMLRNFVQVVRSGVTGRKSLGSRPKRLVREWLSRQDDWGLLRASVGSQPSLADVVKMVHPRPESASRRALYGWLIGREVPFEDLPEIVRSYEDFKAGRTREIPDVPFEMLAGLPIGTEGWTAIAERASWHQTRMNLNAFARNGVFPAAEAVVAERLADPGLVRKARAFPYQLLVARQNLHPRVPRRIRAALAAALEIAVANVPSVTGRVFVCPDVSGSMTWTPATGHRKGATTVVRCIDVAALVAAAVLRKNPDAEVLPFAGDLVRIDLDPGNTIATNATKLGEIGGGATNCSAPIRWLNRRKAKGDFVLFVSDNQSWVDPRAGRGTALMNEWEEFRSRNPGARMACLDIQPYGTTQALEREDVLNIGGFSDRIFPAIAEFAAGRMTPGHWLDQIENTRI